MLLVESRSTKQLYYVDFILNYFKETRVGELERVYMGTRN